MCNRTSPTGEYVLAPATAVIAGQHCRGHEHAAVSKKDSAPTHVDYKTVCRRPEIDTLSSTHRALLAWATARLCLTEPSWNIFFNTKV